MPAKRAHGTRTKYVHDKCRCDPCRVANNRYAAALQRQTSPFQIRCIGRRKHYVVTPRGKAGVVFRAGVDREAAVRHCAALNEDLDPTEPLWASPGKATAVRKYVRVLQARGVGLKTIARHAGLSSTRLREIVLNRSYNKARPRRRKLKAATAEKVLGLRVTAAVAPGALVPAAETWRLVHELLAFGVTKMRLARELGSTAKVPALQLRVDFVRARSAAKVRELHDLATRSERFRAEQCRCPKVS